MLIVGVQACCFLAAEFRRWCSFAILDCCVGRILLAGSWVGLWWMFAGVGFLVVSLLGVGVWAALLVGF